MRKVPYDVLILISPTLYCCPRKRKHPLSRYCGERRAFFIPHRTNRSFNTKIQGMTNLELGRCRSATFVQRFAAKECKNQPGRKCDLQKRRQIFRCRIGNDFVKIEAQDLQLLDPIGKMFVQTVIGNSH